MSSTSNLGWAAYARAIVTAVAHGRDPGEVTSVDVEPRPHHGVFVTLHRGAGLRGCMGVLDAELPLREALRQAAVCAASQDPRFPPLRPSELFDLRIEVSVLSTPRRMQSIDELQIGVHGILVVRGGHRGLFLPQVAVEHRLDREAFLSRCCREKAGLPADAWRHADTEVLLFTTEVERD